MHERFSPASTSLSNMDSVEREKTGLRQKQPAKNLFSASVQLSVNVEEVL